MSRFNVVAAMKALVMTAALPIVAFISGTIVEAPKENSRYYDLGMFAIALGTVALGLAAASIWVSIPKMVLDSSLVATVSFVIPMIGLEAHRAYTKLYMELINETKQE